MKQVHHEKTEVYTVPAHINGETRWYTSMKAALAAKRASQRGKPKPRKDKTKGVEFATHTPHYERVNSAEQKFVDFAVASGLTVHRNGWPDFFCQSPSGGIAAVEVKKGRHDTLSHDQIICFSMLDAAGVKVFVWNRARSRATGAPKLIPWREYARLA